MSAPATPVVTETSPAPSPSPAPTVARPPSTVVEIAFKSGYSAVGLPRSRACRGKVTLELRRGKTVLDRAATRLDRRCRYRVTFRARRSRIGSAKTLTVTVRFHGNRYLGATRNRFRVKVPS